MPKVYIVNRSGHDFSTAGRFGELVYLSEGEVDKLASNEIYRRFTAAMKGSKPDDYILITSLASMCAVAAACFAFKHGTLNLLLYERGRYVERCLKIDELIERR